MLRSSRNLPNMAFKTPRLYQKRSGLSLNGLIVKSSPHFTPGVVVVNLQQKRYIAPVPGLPLEEIADAMNANEEDEDDKNKGKKGNKKDRPKYVEVGFKLLETAGILLASLGVLGLAGLGYHRLYKLNTLSKMEQAFLEGDPAYQLAMHKRGKQEHGGSEEGWVERTHQDTLDKIFSGEVSGRYYLLIGEKGTGKTSMILESMRKVNGSHCAIFDAHSDPEIFRIRLGKALNFEFHEDYLGSLFSIRGPREGSALLDIERAFNILEKVAVHHHRAHKRPLILVINNAHLIGYDDEGQKLIELLQQKAEALGGAGVVTTVFNSDDYWVYERLRKLGTRLEVITINDFSREHAISALRRARKHYNGEIVSDIDANNVYNLVGGRPQHIAAVATQPDLIEGCQKLIDKEKVWFLNQCGLLGEDMDDDVMESGKFSTSAMFLMKALVELDKARTKTQSMDKLGQMDHNLPRIPLWRARQIMTRPDYIQHYDNLNIFTIDSNSLVRADSVPMMQAFHEICSMPGFDRLLEETADRVAAIESLGRTRELVAKDLVLGNKYRIGRDSTGTLEVQYHETSPSEEEDTGNLYHLDREQQKDWWSKRMKRYQDREQDQEVKS